MVNMAGNVYSTYDLAKVKAQERMIELEQDIFICSCEYKSGKEFVLKTRKEMMNGGSYLHIVLLPFNHKFKDKHNAVREADKFAKQLKKVVTIKRNTYEENGYSKFSHFSLCLT